MISYLPATAELLVSIYIMCLRFVCTGKEVVGCCSGGEGGLGLVMSPADQQLTSQSLHGCYHVTWSAGNTNVYKVGFEGKLDLKMIEGASGGFYYPEHLAPLGHYASLPPNGKPVQLISDIFKLHPAILRTNGWINSSDPPRE